MTLTFQKTPLRDVHRQHDLLRVFAWGRMLCHSCAKNSQNPYVTSWLEGYITIYAKSSHLHLEIHP